jgi:hypothetical protein
MAIYGAIFEKYHQKYDRFLPKVSDFKNSKTE